MIDALFTIAFATQLIRIAVPYVLAALGGAVTERAGMIDLALEAKLLFGAFAAAAVGHATDSALLGIAAGIGAGMVVAAVQAYCALWLEADHVIVGIALNIIALSGTRFLLQIIFHEGANSPPAPSYGDAVVTNPLVWFALIAALVVPYALVNTRWGLRSRAAGDRPDALLAVGVSPPWTRMRAALVGGGLAGAGGAQLSLVVGGFSADMSSGRGYIALAMVILAGWRPGIAALACVGVGAAEAFTIQLQLLGSGVARELASNLPHMLTLAVLGVSYGGKHRQPPRSLGSS